jgi:acetyl/propionyl-CoA carboxylase alpha subunit
VQVLADAHGQIVHLGERECSIQRRHQKLIEESPSPAVTPALRQRLVTAAIAAARSVDYINAGTVEFLVTDTGELFFLEMNTRLQVEHPVTEWIYGIDLVQAQIRIAAGEPLWFQQDDLRPRGHAIECRVCAEDPAADFLPRPGTITYLREPDGPGVRVDSGIAAGYEVPVYYDPLLAKLSVWGADRSAARERLIAALREYVVLGITTNVPFLIEVLRHRDFATGATHTHFLDQHFAGWRGGGKDADLAAVALAVFRMLAPQQRQASRAGGARQSSPWETLGPFRVGQSTGACP